MDLAKYNIHKRKTLDRLTARATNRLRLIFELHIKEIAKDFFSALENGRKSFDPKDAGLQKKIEKVLKNHRDEVIHVSVSDGIQEVSPENKLGAWEVWPLNVPIEKTLSISLAGKRKGEVDRIAKKFEKTKQKSFFEVLQAQFDQHMSAIKKAYADASREWLQGEGAKEDVNTYLRRALKVSETSAERIVRTETTAHFNESRMEYFETNTAVDYIQIFAITDGRTSEICDTRHGFVVPIDQAKLKKNMPPFHPNCRTVQRPLLSYLTSHKAIIDKGLKMDERKFASLPKGWA